MRLRTRRQYQCVAQQRVFKFTGRWIVADIRPNLGNFSRLGITVSKRYGAAHQRNRFKRLVREAFRLSYPYFKLNFDVVIRPKPQALDSNMYDIQLEFLSFLEEASYLS